MTIEQIIEEAAARGVRKALDGYKIETVESTAKKDTDTAARSKYSATPDEVASITSLLSLHPNGLSRRAVEEDTKIMSGRMSEIEDYLIREGIIVEITGQKRYKVFNLPGATRGKSKWDGKVQDMVAQVMAGSSHDTPIVLESGMSYENVTATVSHLRKGKHGPHILAGFRHQSGEGSHSTYCLIAAYEPKYTGPTDELEKGRRTQVTT